MFPWTVVTSDRRHKEPELEGITYSKASDIFNSYEEGYYILNNKKHQTVRATDVTIYS
jgi:hypothetical protein